MRYISNNIHANNRIDGGDSWMNDIKRDVQINIPLEKAGDNLRIRAHLLSLDAEISAWGVVF